MTTIRWRCRLTLTLWIGALLCGAVSAAAATPSTQDPPTRAPTVLFMCPHGAAKSVLASAHFRRIAKERGLNVTVESAGTEPDPQIAPAVAAHLRKAGYDVPATPPRRATAADMAGADVVISIGCDLRGLPAPKGRVIEWNDVPSPSADLAAADERIKQRVVALVEELLRPPPR